MNKITIVLKREYLRRVNKKSFIIMTLLTPILFAALIFVPLWLSMLKSDDVYNVAVNDNTGKYKSLFVNTESIKFEMIEGKDLLKEVDSGNYSAIMEISEDLLKNPRALTLFSEKQIPQDLKREISNILIKHLENERLVSFNIPDIAKIIEESHVKLDIQTKKIGKDGDTKDSSSEIASVIGFLFTFMIYMFIMIYGAMVMQGVMEEKTNRIVEVMISSTRPFDLLMGKIIGIGLVGLTQVFIWGILTTILISIGGIFLGLNGATGMSELVSAQQGVNQVTSSFSNTDSFAVEIFTKLSSFNFVEISLCFVLFFIGGYISYASLFAATGAAVDNPEDSQQFMTPIMIFLIFAVYAGIYSVQNPDGPLAFWCSFLPFTSPMVMMVRIPFDIPLWQILLSLVILFSTSVCFVWIAAKIYRTGILMYGKKPSFKEIARWIRYN